VKAPIFLFISLFLIIFSSISNAALLNSKGDSGIRYFLMSVPNKIIRYDTNSQGFLADFTLDQIPSAFTVDGDNVYVAFYRELRKFSLTTGESEFVRNTTANIEDIFLLGSSIYIVESNGNIQILNQSDYSLVDTVDPFYNGQSYTTVESENAYFYRTTNVSPSDLRKATISNTGEIISDVDTSYHGDYPTASKLYLNQSGNKIYDDAGIVYFTSDLTYTGSLAGSIDALAFSGDNAIAARSNTLFLYNPSLHEIGQLSLNNQPLYLSATDENVFSFYEGTNSLEVEIKDLSGFSLPAVGEPADPNTTNYEPDLVDTNGSDTLYLYDQESLTIFQWSTTQNAYLDSWALINPPSWMSYSQSHERLYLGYNSGKITYFDSNSNTEKHFLSLALGVKGLLASGDYLFAADSSGAWNTHYLIDSSGTVTSSEDWRKTAQQYIYSALTNRIYHFRDGTSPNDIEWTEFDPDSGILGNKGDSPYHGSTLYTKYPLRLNLAGDLIVNGAGQLIDGYSLEVHNSLSNNITDAAWFNNNTLITIDETSSNLQFWGNNFALESEYALNSEGFTRVLNLAGDIVLITIQSDTTNIQVFDPNNLPDTDEDGVHDLKDNCINQPNANQENHDNDSLGDICDEDDDNDGLSDTLEISLNLDPKNALDADFDLDSDGFSNRIEIQLGSDISDANSTPSSISSFFEGFENGWPELLVGEKAVNAWQITDNPKSGQYALTSHSLSEANETSEFQIHNFFTAGLLKFDYISSGIYYYRYNLEIEIDGIIQKTLSANYSGYWREASIQISEGVHKIIFRVVLDSQDPSTQLTHFAIDNLSFGSDKDGDGIFDTVDNCPDDHNSGQSDYDGDGLGDSCDSDPYNEDQDSDGVQDYRDNCPETYNPNQSNFDYDYFGDVCDSDIDNDGILNSIEDQYDFLNSYDQSDALEDEDNDGVSNHYEITHGTDPLTKETFEAIDLTGYFPLGTLDYTYGNNSYDNVVIKIRPGGKSGQYTMEVNGVTLNLENRADGVYWTSASSPGSDLKINCTNYLLMPRSMVMGGYRKIDASCTYSNTSGLVQEENIIIDFYLKQSGQFNLFGEDHDALIFGSSIGGDYMVIKEVGALMYDGKTLSSYYPERIDSPAAYVTSEDSDDKILGIGSNTLGFLVLISTILGLQLPSRKIRNY
jgi:hypothetical protein